MTSCPLCGGRGSPVAAVLGSCAACLKKGRAGAEAAARAAHLRSRREFVLPQSPPRSNGGVVCRICANECAMAEGESGYCGLRRCENGRLTCLAGTPEGALVDWYFDPLPTNCVAGWACAATGRGYPRYSYRSGPERGFRNLAVFYRACSFDCLFCQNWHYRASPMRGGRASASDLAAAVTDDTACICHFGGDPSPQLEHAIRASELAVERARGRIIRICWETNGSMNGRLLERMLALSLKSGGCVKFDLKAWDERLHVALTGVSNRRTLENFALAASIAAQRKEPPALVASTLLVPGYVDEEEVGAIARFVASLDGEIPYSLLAFHPDFCMTDLPVTPLDQAQRCAEAARAAGLKNIHLGNIHLLA